MNGKLISEDQTDWAEGMPRFQFLWTGDWSCCAWTVDSCKRRALKQTEQYSLLDYVIKFKYRLYKTRDVAHKNLKESQEKMKT